MRGARVADGNTTFDSASLVEQAAKNPNLFNRFFGTRTSTLKFFCGVASAALTLAVGLNFSPMLGLSLIDAPFIVNLDGWLWLGVASSALLLSLLLLLLDPPDNMAKGPNRALPFATLALLFLLAIGSIAFAEVLAREFAELRGRSIFGSLVGSAPLSLFFALLGTALVARAWNAALFAKYAHTEYVQRQTVRLNPGDDAQSLTNELEAYRRDQGDAEALSSLIATVAVLAVTGFALVAGGWTESTRVGKNAGLMVAVLIFGIFAVVIVLDWLADFPPVRSLSRVMNRVSTIFRPLAGFYNIVDLLLVRIGAHVAGAGHTSAATRYFVIAGTQVSLAIMAWNLPDPLGLIPAFAGFTLALAVSRLWAWVEEDRNLALITQYKQGAPQRIGFKEDYRDEAIFGFMFVLAIVPIALKQADAGQLFNLTYFQDADHNDPLPWFIYFCIEIAKALPIVDWADIYLSPENFDTLKPTDPWGQHATFMARALVDLVLVAALLQAISISLRNRQQKSLYAARQIDRLDELVERVELRRAVARPEEDWFSRGIDFRHYNPERLREVHAKATDSATQKFIEKIFKQAGRQLETAYKVLELLARRRAPLKELQLTFAAVISEHESGKNKLEALDLEDVFESLRDVEGLKNLKLEMLDFAERIGAIDFRDHPTSLASLLEQVIFSVRRDQFQYTRIHAAKILTRIVPRLAEPETVSTLLAKLKAGREDLFGRSQFVPDMLDRALVLRLQEIGAPDHR